MKLEFHPIANVFPLIEGREFDELVADVREHGLRCPIVLHTDGRILDGRNRYRACLAASVEPTFEDWDGVGLASDFVWSLNGPRRHLDGGALQLAAGRYAIAREAEARERQGRRTDLTSSQICDEVDFGKSVKNAAEKFGVGARTVTSAVKVIKEGADDLVHAVESGKVSVSTAADIARLPKEEQREVVQLTDKEILDRAKEIRQERAVERQQQNAEIRARQIELPNGLFDVIVIDPPWPMEKIERDIRPNQSRDLDYPIMQETELAALNIPADEHCHIWLWTTHRFLPMAFRLLEAWQLRYVCTFVWGKPGGFQPIGLPQYNCEFALYARRGSPTFVTTKSFSTLIEAPRGAHSEKPEAFYDVVRRVTEGRRLDMFNRRVIDGFTGWGKEAEAAD